jgi:hypothetical protein
MSVVSMSVAAIMNSSPHAAGTAMHARAQVSSVSIRIVIT